MTRSRSVCLLTSLVFTALLLAGCGAAKSTPKQQVRSTMLSYTIDAYHHDAAAACSLMSAALQKLAALGRSSCEKSLDKAPSLNAAAFAYEERLVGQAPITVTGTRATMTLGPNKIPFERINGRWLLTN